MRPSKPYSKRSSLAFHLQAHQHPVFERTEECIALPAREPVADVESEAGGRDGWGPGVRGRRRACAILGAARPAVVGAFRKHHEAVVLVLAVLADPDAPRDGMQRRALHVAVAERENLAPACSGVAKRVVGGRRAVIAQAHDLARKVVKCLRARGHAPVAERDVQQAFVVEHQPRSIVPGRGRLGLEPEDHRDILQGLLAQPRANHLGAAPTLAARAVGQIDEPVVAEARMQRNIEQPAMVFGIHLRNTAQRRRPQRAICLDDA
jgi:hypothetical protein